jgi:hypothetical protein
LFFSYKLQQAEGVLKEEKLLDILLEPTRIFNGDESCLIFPKGWKSFSMQRGKNCMKLIEALQERP